IYKTNIALFSNYIEGRLYDEGLMKNFVPHVTDLSKIEDTNPFEFVELLTNDVKRLEDFLLQMIPSSEVKGRFLIQLWHLRKKMKLYLAIKINDIKYLDTY